MILFLADLKTLLATKLFFPCFLVAVIKAKLKSLKMILSEFESRGVIFINL